MTRVCLVGDADVNLRYELLSRETAREALATYDLREPFENTVGVETVSLGGAVAILNDLDWYLVRFVDEALVLEPSVSDAEWLSRDLATAVRDDKIAPAETDRFLKVYGLEPVDDVEGVGDAMDVGPGNDPADAGNAADSGDATDAGNAADTGDAVDPWEADGGSRRSADGPAYRLVEPMYVTRTGGELPEYDLRDVEETLVERVTESEFGA